MLTQLTATQVRRARWESLGLGSTRASSILAVVDRLGALQGQDLPGVLLSIALRVENAAVDDVQRSFDDRSLVRGWPMRGTLHAMRAEDLLPLTQITQTRSVRSMAGAARTLGITDAQIDSTLTSVTDDLRKLGTVTRAELRELVTRANPGERRREAISHLIYHLSVRGLICHGPFRDNQQLMVHTESWVGHLAAPDPDDFLSRMLMRYVSGHAPVSEADAARWFSLPLSAIRAARSALGDDIVDVLTPTGTQWMVSGAETERILSTLHVRPSVRLLPGFDEFMLGYADRSFAVPIDSLTEIVPGKNGMFRPTVCAGASVVATWSKAAARNEVNVSPFSPLSGRTQNGIRSAARELTRITGKPISVQLPPLV